VLHVRRVAGGPGRADDKQLAGAWGAGERLYRSGPWQPGTPRQGYQLPFTPAERFRTALSAINKDLAGRPFAKMTPDISIFEPCFAPQYAGGCASGFRVRWGAMR
jgi:hypothetical protein